jgi:hypothetical protein
MVSRVEHPAATSPIAPWNVHPTPAATLGLAGDSGSFALGAMESLEWSMPDATYVAFVPKGMSAKLRSVLQSEDTGQITWRERKVLFGSEFYFSGPPSLARATHAYVSQWVALH